MRVIAELLGVPAADWPRYQRWSDVILKLANTFTKDEEAARTIAEYRAATAEMRAAPPGLIEQRRSAGQEALLTRVVDAEVDDGGRSGLAWSRRSSIGGVRSAGRKGSTDCLAASKISASGTYVLGRSAISKGHAPEPLAPGESSTDPTQHSNPASQRSEPSTGSSIGFGPSIRAPPAGDR
jgi:hypothetical protein